MMLLRMLERVLVGLTRYHRRTKMRCTGTTKKGKRCRRPGIGKSRFCSQHNDHLVVEPGVEEPREPCARCGPAKESIQDVQVGPEISVPLCMSCSISLLRTVLEFTGVEDIDAKLLEFRESF